MPAFSFLPFDTGLSPPSAVHSGLLPLALRAARLRRTVQSGFVPDCRARPREPKAHRESRPLCRLFRFRLSVPGSHRLRRWIRALLALTPSGHCGFASVSESAVLPIRDSGHSGPHPFGALRLRLRVQSGLLPDCRARPREPQAHRESRPLRRLFRVCHSTPGSLRRWRWNVGCMV